MSTHFVFLEKKKAVPEKNFIIVSVNGGYEMSL